MSRYPLAAVLLAGLTRLVTGVRARWVGDPPGAGQRLYFANHSSHLDALVIWSSLPTAMRERTRPVAAVDYWDRPGVRRWLACGVLDALLIARDGGRGGREALRAIGAALDRGDSLILFPEGTRGAGETIGPLEPGLYFVAKSRPTVQLVPVYLQDLNRILPKGEVLPVPLIGSATFGAPLELRDDEGREGFLGRARDALLALGTAS